MALDAQNFAQKYYQTYYKGIKDNMTDEQYMKFVESQTKSEEARKKIEMAGGSAVARVSEEDPLALDYVNYEDTGISNYLDLITINDDGNIPIHTQEELITDMMSTNMSGIEALPYQFLETVDPRIKGTGTNSTAIGRKYAEKIMGRLPLLFLTPCFPQALADFSKEDKQSVINMLIDSSFDEDLINGDGRYYNVSFAYDEYYRYLNCMLASVVAFLGIYDEEVNINGKSVKLGEFDWSKEANDSFKTFFDARENIVFYLDQFNTISESFSNETTESSIASQINSLSDTANEVKFLLAGNSGALGKIASNLGDAVGSISSALSGAIGELGGGIVGSLADKGVSTLVNGGKIIFPQIWSNSNYSRSYSLSIKLRSPDHDTLSIFFNILKPYCKLLAMVLPRVMNNTDVYNVNGYESPFLVKAFSKGKFNVDMGIISSMSVTKGGEGMWNDDGLPTQLDIELEITDLYSALAMSGFENTGIHMFKATQELAKIVNNTAYMDFLANMAGLNVGTMAIGRRVKMYNYLANTAIKQFPSRKFMEFDRRISSFMGNLYNIF